MKAIDKACSHRPDIVLMDIRMPEIDGLEAARQIQDCCPTPIVILTAYESTKFCSKSRYRRCRCLSDETTQTRRTGTGHHHCHGEGHSDLVELRRLNKELELALDEVKRLRGILPICTKCKKIRDDQGYWQQIETYIREHSEADFSHGICPDCAKELYPEFYDK